ncbi:S49 family peptidase [Ornithobacterium rhinotracheale]|uniref:S49 family peptidase n=1 Tax=Ornithobacterium rhinotracheale TaxID=28251 RepID=UPI004036D9A4
MNNNLLFQPLSMHKPFFLSTFSKWMLALEKKDLPISNWDELYYVEKINKQDTGSAKSPKPIIMDVMGPITKYSDWWLETIGTQFLGHVIRALDESPAVSHIILNIDSGGGMVSGTKEFCEKIRSCSKPTIAFTNGYACSAAQQIFSAANLGVVSPYADLMGSIGTMISYQDFAALYEKMGAKIYEAYAPQSTEKNKEFREWEKGNEKFILEDLRKHTDNFINSMKEYRGDKLKDDGLIFKGKTYRPEEAVEVGLADEMMTLEELINKL